MINRIIRTNGTFLKNFLPEHSKSTDSLLTDHPSYTNPLHSEPSGSSLLSEYSSNPASLILACILMICFLLGTPSSLLALKHFLTSSKETITEQMFSCMSVLGAMVCIAQIPLLERLVRGCSADFYVDRRVLLALEDWQEILQRSLVFCGLILSGSKALRILVPKWKMTGDHSGVLLILYCMKLFGELEARRRHRGSLGRNPLRIDVCHGVGEWGGLRGWSRWLYCLDATLIPLLMLCSLIVIISKRYSRLFTTSIQIVVVLTSTLLIGSLPNLALCFQITVLDRDTDFADTCCIRILNRVVLVPIVTFNAAFFLWKMKSLRKFGLRTGKGLKGTVI